MLECKPRRPREEERLFKFRGSGAKRVNLRSTKKSHQKSRSGYWERRSAKHGRPDSKDVNISFFLGQPQSNRLSGNAKNESLDVTLNNLIIQCMEMGLAGWLDVSVWFIRALNYVLDRLNFKVR